MLLLSSTKEDFDINLPTNLNELTPELLSSITADIKISRYYAIVALCFKIKLIDIAININNNKEQSVSVVPLLVKVSEEDIPTLKGKIGDKLIINKSSLERGDHLTVPVMISSSNVKTYIRTDETLCTRLLNGGDGSVPVAHITPPTASNKEKASAKSKTSPAVYILEFKVVALNDITAYIPIDTVVIDPFTVKRNVLVS